jgi:hypothetical protein
MEAMHVKKSPFLRSGSLPIPRHHLLEQFAPRLITQRQSHVSSFFYPLWDIAFARVLGYPYSQEDSAVMLSAAKHLDAHPLSPDGILNLCLRLMHIGRP